MRIALVSDHHATTLDDPERHRDFEFLRRCAVALTRQGLQVLWCSSTDTAEALARDTDIACGGEDDLPATCRYVIPCQSYGFDGVQLICTDRTLWRQPDLHTRLFTFLQLLHRESPCDLLHAWGSLSALYVGVYTARFIGIPSVGSFSRLWFDDGSPLTFEGRWVNRNLNLALVSDPKDRQRLLVSSPLVPERVQVVTPALPTVGTRLAALYQGLVGP